VTKIPVTSSRIRPNSLPHLNGAPVYTRDPSKLPDRPKGENYYPQKREVAPTKKRKLAPTIAETTANKIPATGESLAQPSSGASSMQSGMKTNIDMPMPDSVASAIIPQQDHNIKGNKGVKVSDSGHLLNQTWWRKEKKRRSKPTGRKRPRTAPLIPQFDLKSCLVGDKGPKETAIATKFASSWQHDYVGTDKNIRDKNAITFRDNDVHGATIGGSNVTISESPFASTVCGTKPVAAVEKSIVHSTRTRESRRLQAQAKFKSEVELKLRCPQCQRVFSATWMDMTEESMSRHIARCQKRIKKNIEHDLLSSAIHHAKEAAVASSKILSPDNCGDSVSDLSGDSRRRSSPMTALAKHRKRIIISARRSPSENAVIRAERARSIRGIFVYGEQRQALEDIILRDTSAYTGNVYKSPR